jgi:hypothetical protein
MGGRERGGGSRYGTRYQVRLRGGREQTRVAMCSGPWTTLWIFLLCSPLRFSFGCMQDPFTISYLLISESNTRIGKYAMKKFRIDGRLWNKLFLITIHYFSLVKAKMKALRVCKLRKKCLTSIDQCALVLSKHLNFFVSIGAFMIVNCGMKKKFISKCAINFNAHIKIFCLVVN